MYQMKTIIAITLWVFFLIGCSGTHPFIPPVAGQPGYPGEQHDLFPCAAHRIDFPNFNIDEISWDTNLGAFQNNNINLTYLPGQFSGPVMSGNQRNGWFMDDAGYAYFAQASRTNTIEVYQSTVGAYKLGAWALWAADNTQTWENIDFSGYDDYIFGVAYESGVGILHGMWLDTNTPPLVFLTSTPLSTFVNHYSCIRFGDSLYGPLHYIWDDPTLGLFYNFIGPPSAGTLSMPFIGAVPLEPLINPLSSCQITGDFEERLWAFIHDSVFPQIGCQIAFSNLTNPVWENIGSIPFPTPNVYAWKCSTRYTDDTIHAVAIYIVPDGANWDYQLWYTRRFKSGWMTAEMIDNWAVNGLNKAFQDARLSAQITTSPSGIMLWTIQYDAVLGIGDVCAYFLGPNLYHAPVAGNWTTYLDADGTNYDYLELNAPTFWRM